MIANISHLFLKIVQKREKIQISGSPEVHRKQFTANNSPQGRFTAGQFTAEAIYRKAIHRKPFTANCFKK
jgi:hypothetical protein